MKKIKRLIAVRIYESYKESKIKSGVEFSCWD